MSFENSLSECILTRIIASAREYGKRAFKLLLLPTSRKSNGVNYAQDAKHAKKVTFPPIKKTSSKASSKIAPVPITERRVQDEIGGD